MVVIRRSSQEKDVTQTSMEESSTYGKPKLYI